MKCVGDNSREMYWVQFPLAAFPIDRKLSTIEELLLDQSRLSTSGVQKRPECRKSILYSIYFKMEAAHKPITNLS